MVFPFQYVRLHLLSDPVRSGARSVDYSVSQVLGVAPRWGITRTTKMLPRQSLAVRASVNDWRQKKTRALPGQAPNTVGRLNGNRI